MAKDPAILWYPGDYLAGTTEFTFEEKGAYVEILMKQFENGGPLSEDRIKRILREKYQAIWTVIKDKFTQDEKGDWFNERLEEERAKRKKFTQSRRNNRMKATSEKQVSNTSESLVPHMENGNGIENEDWKYELKKEPDQKNSDSPDFKDYERWTADIIAGNDGDFEQMVMHQRLNLDRLEPLAREYLGLIAQYPNKEPPDQHRFRIAVLEHVRKNSNGTTTQPKKKLTREELKAGRNGS